MPTILGAARDRRRRDGVEHSIGAAQSSFFVLKLSQHRLLRCDIAFRRGTGRDAMRWGQA